MKYRALEIELSHIFSILCSFWSKKNRSEISKSSLSFITARCTLVQSAVLRSHVVCLSVCLSVTLVNC